MKAHTRYLTKRVKKNGIKKKEGKHSVHWTLDFVISGGAIYFCTINFLTWDISDIFSSIRTNTHVRKFDEKTNSDPRRETTRARSRSPPAESGETSMVRHVDQTPHRMVDLISRWRAFMSSSLILIWLPDCWDNKANISIHHFNIIWLGCGPIL